MAIIAALHHARDEHAPGAIVSEVVITRELAAPPSAVWPHVTDPAKMNAWSLAKITLDDPGEGGLGGAVGALRSVTIESGPVRSVLREVVEHADAPSRFVYRVIEGVPLRHHRGEITLDATARGSRLTWRVAMEFPLPGLSLAMRALVLPQLEASVSRLADLAARGLPEDASQPATTRDDALDEGAVEGLLREADAILAAQRALSQRLEAANDPRHWFARVYAFVTACQIEAVRAHAVTHRAWVLRLIPVFHRYYADNLRRFVGELPGVAEPHWEMALRRMAPRGREAFLTTLTEGFRDAIRAHIEGDLPRALAEVHQRHYAGRCELVRFRADYLLMTPLFREASERFLDTLPPRYVPFSMRLARRWAPPESVDVLTARTFYDYLTTRREAFARAMALVGER